MTETTNLRVLIIVDVQKCFLDGNLGIQGEKIVLEGGEPTATELENKKLMSKVDVNSSLYNNIKQLIKDNDIDLTKKDLNSEYLNSIKQKLINKEVSNTSIRGIIMHIQTNGLIESSHENSQDDSLSTVSSDENSKDSISEILRVGKDDDTIILDSPSESVSLTSSEEDSEILKQYKINVNEFCKNSENLTKTTITPAKASKFYSLYIERLKKFYDDNKDKYDVIVFTKDNHPKHHASHGTLNPHCINRFGDYCGDKEREQDISKKFSNSYFYNFVIPDIVKDGMTSDDFYINQIEKDTGAKYQKYEKTTENVSSRKDNEENEGKTLGIFEEIPYNAKIYISQEGLELSSTVTDLKSLNVGRFTKVELDKDNKIGTLKPYIVRLNKGELCNFDSFGAFYYHVEYENETGNEIDYFLKGPRDDLNLSKLSTGLIEFLLDRKSYADHLKDKNINIEFDVCGLVTNICVVSTCVSGTNILEQYLAKPHRSDIKLIDYHFNILNEFCVNLTLPHRNAQKIINTNRLGDAISITEGLDIQDYNPVTYN